MNNEKFLAEFETILERAVLVSEKARREGLFAIEDFLDNTKIANRDIFEYGLQFVVDGYDSEIIEKILSNLIKQEKDETAILFKAIQKEAVLSIQAGENTRVLVYKLNSYTNIPLDDPLMKKIFEDLKVFEGKDEIC